MPAIKRFRIKLLVALAAHALVWPSVIHSAFHFRAEDSQIVFGRTIGADAGMNILIAQLATLFLSGGDPYPHSGRGHAEESDVSHPWCARPLPHLRLSPARARPDTWRECGQAVTLAEAPRRGPGR